MNTETHNVPLFTNATILSAEGPFPKSKILALSLFPLDRNQQAMVKPLLPVEKEGIDTYCEEEATNWRLADPTMTSAVEVDAPFTSCALYEAPPLPIFRTVVPDKVPESNE